MNSVCKHRRADIIRHVRNKHRHSTTHEHITYVASMFATSIQKISMDNVTRFVLYFRSLKNSISLILSLTYLHLH